MIPRPFRHGHGELVAFIASAEGFGTDYICVMPGLSRMSRATVEFREPSSGSHKKKFSLKVGGDISVSEWGVEV